MWTLEEYSTWGVPPSEQVHASQGDTLAPQKAEPHSITLLQLNYAHLFTASLPGAGVQILLGIHVKQQSSRVTGANAAPCW